MSATTIANTPFSVTVVFPRADDGVLGTDTYTIAYPGGGHAGTEIIHCKAVANFTALGAVPDNLVELAALANRIGQDWYTWRLASLEVRYENPVPWISDGMHDVEYLHETPPLITAVYRSAWEPEGPLMNAGTFGSGDKKVPSVWAEVVIDGGVLIQIGGENTIVTKISVGLYLITSTVALTTFGWTFSASTTAFLYEVSRTTNTLIVRTSTLIDIARFTIVFKRNGEDAGGGGGGGKLKCPCHPPAKLKTTKPLPPVIYDNGIAGGGALLTAISNGPIVLIDGFAPTLNDYLLITNQENAYENGLYILIQVGDATKPFILKRAPQMDTATKFPGAIILILEGIINGGTTWRTGSGSNPTVGTTPVTFDLIQTKKPWSVIATAAAAAALPSNTYANGTSGYGATLTGTANGALTTIDGVTLIVGDLILVRKEADKRNNGLYVVTQIGDAGTPYILTRYGWMDTVSKYQGVTIEIYKGTKFYCTEFKYAKEPGFGEPILGTDDLDFMIRWPGPIKVDVATTGILPGAPTYDNGLSNDGVGATLTASSNGALAAIDGVTPVLGTIILVKNQATASQNGVYEVVQVGSAGTPYILKRVPENNSSSQFVGMLVDVATGAIGAGSTWRFPNTSPPVLGTDAISPSWIAGNSWLGSVIDAIYLGAGITTIASAGTVDLATAPTVAVKITGSTGPITSFGTVAAGIWHILTFASTPTITNSGSVILPGGVDFTAAAGDMAIALSLGSGNWQLMIFKADGTAVVGGGFTWTEGTLAATGSVQGDAALITTRSVNVTGADGTKGVILPASTTGQIAVQNTSLFQIKVYPNSGAAIGGGGTNIAHSFSGLTFLYTRISATQWRMLQCT